MNIGCSVQAVRESRVRERVAWLVGHGGDGGHVRHGGTAYHHGAADKSQGVPSHGI